MSRSVLNLMVAGILLCTGVSFAESLPVKLVLGNGKVWSGTILKRDGDWIDFKKDNSSQPIRIGVGTVKELNFEVQIDSEELLKMIRDREFEKAIEMIDHAIAPFSEYSDIPSNLTRYNILLMELLYNAGKYDESLAISSQISQDDRDPVMQEKARVFQALALVNTGQIAETEVLFASYGWDLEPAIDASPEKLYIAAKYLMLKKKFNRAIEYAARVVAFHSQDPDWLQPAELLCAQIYTELGLYDSADEVCREILLFYKNTPEFDEATRLKIKIEKLRAEQRMKDSLQPE